MARNAPRIREFPSHGICSRTGKKMFTHRVAEKVAREMRRQKSSNHRAYRCPACRYAHVGSSTTMRGHAR